MENREDWNPKSKLILAVLLIGAGILLLAKNFDLISGSFFGVDILMAYATHGFGSSSDK
ncbi:MAG: hypothetical protein HC905_31250 [Bacteroidales bacterium]|nr:hypothetical protein [Bacteroidales bacterium]